MTFWRGSGLSKVASWSHVTAIALIVLAAVLWFGLLRHGLEQTGRGLVLEKTQRAVGAHAQYPVEANRSFRQPNVIRLEESFVFEVRLDGTDRPVRVSFNTVKARQFVPGQRVEVQFISRGFPPLWQRISIVDMRPLGNP